MGTAGAYRRRSRGRRRRPTRRTGWVAAGVILSGALAGAVVAAVMVLGGGQARHPRSSAPDPRAAAPAAGPAGGLSRHGARLRRPLSHVSVRDLGPILPHALVGLAAAALGPHIYLFGGDGPAGFTGAVQVFTPGTAAAAPAVSTVANLPVALHDGAAAAAGGALWFCGGGQSVGTSSIYRWRPGGTPVAVAGLGQPMSDMAGVTVNGHGLCLGGWTGAAYSAAVFEPAGARPQGTAPVVGQLVHAVRYAGASPLAGGVLVAGGRLASGQPTDLLQWMAPSPYEVGAFVAARDVGRLPQPLAYVMAAPLDGQVLVIGGVGPGGASAEIWDIAAPGARPRAVGQLPAGLSYGAAATLGGTVYVFGGNLSGTPSDQVLAITADT